MTPAAPVTAIFFMLAASSNGLKPSPFISGLEGVKTNETLPEVALQAQRTLADAMPILVMMSDPDGVVNYFNRRWFDFTGQPYFERDVAWDWQKYMHPDDGPRVAAEWAEAVAQGRDVIEMQYRLREAATGQYCLFQARAAAVRNKSGEITQWFGTALQTSE